jgi:hypothetical protein
MINVRSCRLNSEHTSIVLRIQISEKENETQDVQQKQNESPSTLARKGLRERTKGTYVLLAKAGTRTEEDRSRT